MTSLTPWGLQIRRGWWIVAPGEQSQHVAEEGGEQKKLRTTSGVRKAIADELLTGQLRNNSDDKRSTLLIMEKLRR